MGEGKQLGSILCQHGGHYIKSSKALSHSASLIQSYNALNWANLSSFSSLILCQVFYDSSHSLPRSSWVRFWLWFFVKCPFFLSRRQNPSKYTPHTFLVRLIHNLHPLVDPPIHTGSSLSCPHDKYHIPLPQSWTWRGLQAS